MKKNISVFICVTLLVMGWGLLNPCTAADEYDKSDLQQDAKKADKFVEKYGITEALGPLAPVAMSPFFGLACLSGTSILCEMGVLPKNDFLQGNEVLNNWLVFLLFAGLTVVTSVPKMVSVSKVFAEAVDRVETYAGIISYGVILLAAQQGAPQEDVVVYSAGFISLTSNGLLACMAAVNIFVIGTVRFFFELLVLVSPIPTLDAIFECTNKGLAGIIACIYAFNPYLAFVLNVILFLICLVIFKWVNRRLRYYKAVLLEPILLGMVRKLLGRETYNPDWKIKRRLSRDVSGIQLVVKCFPSRKLDKIKKKDMCYLAFGDEGPMLVRPHLFKRALVRKLAAGEVSSDIQEGLTAYSVILTDGAKPCELIFGRVYTEKLDAIKAKLGELRMNNSVQ